MHLPSKLNSKHLGYAAVIIFFLFLPFKNAVENFAVFFCQRLSPAAGKNQQLTEELKERNLKLSLQLKELQYLKEENENLKEALKFREEKNLNLIGAQITSFDPSIWRKIVIINAGQKQGVKPGLYALDEKGRLIGKIITVQENYAHLIFVDDPNFNAPVFVGEAAFGLLKGGLGGAKILYVENDEKVSINDKIQLKIPSLNFPIYAGEIKKCAKNENSLFWDIDVKLFSQNPSFHNIFIVQ